MNPTLSGKATDKENEVLADAAAVRSVATLAKQASLVGSRTPSSLQGHKMGLTRTTSQQGKITPQTVGSPTVPGILRTKTNYQQTPTAPEPLKDVPAKKSTLTRTFSATFESNTGDTTPSVPIHSESRRRSLTRRGSVKSRLVVHKDEEGFSLVSLENDESMDNNNAIRQSTKSSETLVKGSTIESTTTLLSIERAVESHEKVVVGAADAKTKRRALTNDEDRLDIEYCPPPVKEQPYDPGFELDKFALSTIPPAHAYHMRAIDTYDIGLPTIEPAPIRRSLSPTELEEGQKEAVEKEGSMPKATFTADGHLEFTWSDDEDDEGLYRKGGRCFGIKDLYDDTKTLPPFDGFIFDVEDGHCFGIEDLYDESKTLPPFDGFVFDV